MTDTTSGPTLIIKEIIVRQEDPRRAVDLLALHTKIPKLRIKDAMAKGAVWHAHQERKPVRLRRVTTELAPGDRIGNFSLSTGSGGTNQRR
jgi:tRNA pseudouridine32 synthase / 23S rRNA pseudouridine746 synthase